jgi:hypothetical protein
LEATTFRQPGDDHRFLLWASARESCQEKVIADLEGAPEGFAHHGTPPLGEAERGQLLRALASDSIRGGLERHFGVKLAFQNCHRVGAFSPSEVDSARYRAFISPRGQLLNQNPELRDC